jgi:hypothetical protein
MQEQRDVNTQGDDTATRRSVRKRKVQELHNVGACLAQEHAFLVQGREWCFNTQVGAIPVPRGIKQAQSGEYKQHWHKAILAEWNGCWDADCFEYVKYEDLPARAVVMDLVWQFKVKPDRLKARCCVNGKQEPQDEYDDIFSPVCKHTTMRMLLWQCVVNSWDLGSSDVHLAYLNSPNDKDQYCHAPPNLGKPGHCLKLKRMLYGLHASGLRWNELITSWLTAPLSSSKKAKNKNRRKSSKTKVHGDGNSSAGATAAAGGDSKPKTGAGMTQSKAGECLFYLEEGDKKMYVVVYVDDLLYAGDSGLIAKFKSRLSDRFKVRHMDASNYLGLDIEYDRKEGKLKIHQKRYLLHDEADSHGQRLP